MTENKNPIVTFTMENGKQIEAELYPEIAPNTVNNFISLVKKKVLQWTYFSQGNFRIYDSRWLS